MNRFLISLFCGVLVFSFSTVAAQDDVNEVVLRDLKSNNTIRIEDLIRRGNADVNYRDANGASLLMWAAYKTNLDFVQKLVKLGADPKIKGVIYLNDDKTAFYGSLMSIAVAESKPELVKYLIEELKIPVDDREYDPTAKSDAGWTGIEWASQKLDKTLISYFVSKGAAIQDGVFVYGGLHLMTLRKHQETIEWTRWLMNEFKDKTIGDSSLVVTYQILANAKSGLGQYKEAIEDYLTGLKYAEAAKSQAHPFLYALHIGLGGAYQNTKDWPKALEQFKTVIDNPKMLASARFWVVIDYPNRTVEALARLGWAYMETGQYAEAEKTLLDALQRSRAVKKPNIGSVNVLNLLGNLMLRQKKYDAARAWFEQGTVEVPALQRPREFVGLGEAYCGLKMYDKAEAACQKALDLTVPGADKGSLAYARASVKIFSLFYVQSERYEKIIPNSSVYMRLILDPKNSAAIKSEEDMKTYTDYHDINLLVASLAPGDSAFNNLTYDYLARVAGRTDNWRQVQSKLGKKDAVVEIFPSLTFSRETFPSYYGAVISKSSPGVQFISLYDKSPMSDDLQHARSVVVSHMKETPGHLSERSEAMVAALKSAGGTVTVKLPADKKPDITSLFNFDTRKFFLQGMEEKDVKVK